jgi:hypothetical protein
VLELRDRQESHAGATGHDLRARLQVVHSNVSEHREPGRRFMLHGVPAWLFFHRGKRLGGASGWHGLGQFEAAVATAREKIRAVNAKADAHADGSDSGKSSTD